MLLSTILEQTVPTDVEITDITLDSRAVTRGSLFCALTGNAKDGHSYIPDAVSRGAAAVLHEKKVHSTGDNTVMLHVNNLKEKLPLLAKRFYHSPNNGTTLVAVTGTNGKTSVAILLLQLLQQLGVTTGYIGTLGWGTVNLIPTTLTSPDVFGLYKYLQQLKQKNCRWIIVEASSHALDQGRMQGVQFAYGVFTNLSRDHFDYHTDYQSYFTAKKKLFLQSAKAVLNLDDRYGRKLYAQLHQLPKLGYSIDSRLSEEKHITTASDISCRLTGSTFTLSHRKKSVRCSTSLIGRFAVGNIVAATSILLDMGYALTEIQSAIECVHTAKGRMEQVAQKPYIFIDFAHTPSALENVLQELKNIVSGRLLLVFGCGGDRDAGKRPLMGEIAKKYADAVFLTNDNPRTEDPARIIAQIMHGMSSQSHVYVVEDRRQAISMALSQADNDDCVLIAGKGHETGQLINDQKLAFSDHEVVHNMVFGQ